MQWPNPNPSPFSSAMSHNAQILFLLLSIVPLLSAQYKPADYILINCGSIANVPDALGRQWRGDSLSRPLLTTGTPQQARARFQDPSVPSAVPFMTASVFASEATYKFPVSKDDRHFLRLYFYPTVYVDTVDLDSTNAYFDVTASGGLTLMRNFSAYDTCRALVQAYVIKEFSLPPSPDGFLTLTLTPSKDHQGSCAFVNGIEIVSMPGIFDEPVPFVGSEDETTLDIGSSGLQTMYRLNVGGGHLTPANDTGLGRYWYDDTPYLSAPATGVTFGASIGLTYSAPAREPILYSKNEKATHAAPEAVYRTYRSMGVDSNLNLMYNLSWAFPVDGNFTYMVRLHMCESEMTMVNQRVFDIVIDDKMAQRAADVIGWSSERLVPIYRDYVVYVDATEGDDMLWVSVKPNDESKPSYYDSILNGLEIFKMSDGSGSFAGRNLVP